MTKHSVLAAMIFLLAAPLAAQSVKVTSPNGNESWPLKSKHAITWTFQNAGSMKVNIILRNAGGVVGTLKSRVDLSAGSWTWDPVGSLENGITVPPAADYVIRIRDADNSFRDDSDKPFTVAPTVPVVHRLPERPLPVDMILKRPKLAVTEIDLAPNAEGFGIVFNYKNVGNGSLPKAAEVPVKPSYRVLIDGRETASGSLFVPAFSAPPGWEQKGYFGGWIVLPTVRQAADTHWHIGNLITVHVNENKAMGMESHSLSMNLKAIAMKYKYDLVRTGIALDWRTRELSVSLQLKGNVPAGRELLAWCGWMMGDDSYFMSRQMAKPGFFVVKRKVNFPAHYDQVKLYLVTVVSVADDQQQVGDMDYRNDQPIELKFVRPDPNPVL